MCIEPGRGLRHRIWQRISPAGRGTRSKDEPRLWQNAVTAALSLALAAALTTIPAFADSRAAGNPAAGETVFQQCSSCHRIQIGGEVLAGRGRAGPNLAGIDGRRAGSVPAFNYGESMVAAGEAGLVWDEAKFLDFVASPRMFLQRQLDDRKARSRMSFQLRRGGADVWSYITSFQDGTTD
ncbi:MAG: c-type cytochrome [Pseudomonadota bacterium]